MKKFAFSGLIAALVFFMIVLMGCGSGGTCTLTTNVTPEGTGTVERKPNKTSFAPGKKVTIKAIPAEGYTFVGWTVTEGQAQFADAKNATTNITLGANPTITISANFRLDQFNSKVTYGSFNDSRDGQSYRTVKIGNVTWMAENLNFKMESSKCGGVDAATGLQYGQFYELSNRMSACPSDWILPTLWDWQNLIEAAGGEHIAGKNLKSSIGWKDGGNGTDEFGFSAIPSDKDASSGTWWNAENYRIRTDGIHGIISRYMLINSNSSSMKESSSGWGSHQYHIRCIQLDKEQMAARELALEEERLRELQRLQQQKQAQQQQKQAQQQQKQKQQERQQQQWREEARLARERWEQQQQQRREEDRLARERWEQQQRERWEQQERQRQRR